MARGGATTPSPNRHGISITITPNPKVLAEKLKVTESDIKQAVQSALNIEAGVVAQMVRNAFVDARSNYESTKRFAAKVYAKQPSAKRIAGDRLMRSEVRIPARARTHTIKAIKAQALYFYWKKIQMWTLVPRRLFNTTYNRRILVIEKGFVNHPGGSLMAWVKPIGDEQLERWQKSAGPSRIQNAVKDVTDKVL